MCSFVVTNRTVTSEISARANRWAKARGPDATNHFRDADTGITWIHNLLHITGEVAFQPFVTPDDLVVLFNGQVYNFKTFEPSARSDGYCIGPAFSRGLMHELDGEFAIVVHDKAQRTLHVFTDAFATKPCWISIDGSDFAICSYKSCNLALGFRNAFLSRANSHYTIDLRSKDVQRSDVHEWDLRQIGGSLERWCELFDLAIEKRIAYTSEKFFVGLSGGYDSGAIVCGLQKAGAVFTTYSVRADEDVDILKKRHELLDDSKKHMLRISERDYRRHRHHVDRACENYKSEYVVKNKRYSVQSDKGSIGTSYICEQAKNDNFKIYMSGHGADEVYSDYGFDGRAIFDDGYGDIFGLYPENLEDIFPWKNFNGYRMTDFAYKDESVGGSYGIEVRYPFLDRALVQEFLRLAPGTKNGNYKSPLFHYLKENDYPFLEGPDHKVGFRANRNLTHAGGWPAMRRRRRIVG